MWNWWKKFPNLDGKWWRKIKKSIDKKPLNLVKKQGGKPKDKTQPSSSGGYTEKEL